MKTRVVVTAVALFAGMIAPSFAFDGFRSLRSQSLVTTVTCDTRNEDDQAQCASKCEDAFVRGKQNNMTNQAANEAEKKACDAKCGCPQNTK